MTVSIPAVDGPDSKGALGARFIPFCFTDLASLHAVMLMAAAHYSNARGSRAQTIDALHFRGRAISEINNALQDPARATSDQTIAAVAQLAAFEALCRDRDAFNTHMTGVARMVSLRGGLAALGLDGLLERVLLWIDSNAAHIAGTKVYFDKTSFPTSVEHPRPDPQRFSGGLARQRT